MAMTEMNYMSGGGGELTCDVTSFSAQSSITINCEVGDIVVIGVTRNASGQAFYWNNTELSTGSYPPEYIGHYNSGNTFTWLFKSSQQSNTFRAGTTTITGIYGIVTN